MKIKHYIALGAVISAAIAGSISYLAIGGGSKAIPFLDDSAYAASLQKVLDSPAVRPKGEPRDWVTGCVVHGVRNVHFCTWIYRGHCHGALIVETPGQGPVPIVNGVAPQSEQDCKPTTVLNWMVANKVVK